MGEAREFVDRLIRSELNELRVAELVKTLYGFTTTSVKELDSYCGQNFLLQVSETHSNPHINELWPHGFVFKVANNEDTLLNHIDAEHACLRHLASRGFQVSNPVPNLDGQYTSLQLLPKKSGDTSSDVTFIRHMVHMVTFMPGTMMDQTDITADTLFQVGRFSGRLKHAMKEFNHPGVAKVNIISGNLAKIIPQMDQFFSVITDKENRELAEKSTKMFIEEVLPQCHKFQKSVIHGDLTPHNVLIPSQFVTSDQTVQCENYGLIDFGDMNDSYCVFDVAVSIMQFMLQVTSVDAVSVGGHILAGYLQESHLNEDEIKALRACVIGRFIHAVVLSKYIHTKEPWNAYLLEFVNNGWSQLKKFYAVTQDEILENWMKTVSSCK